MQPATTRLLSQVTQQVQLKRTAATAATVALLPRVCFVGDLANTVGSAVGHQVFCEKINLPRTVYCEKINKLATTVYCENKSSLHGRRLNVSGSSCVGPEQGAAQGRRRGAGPAAACPGRCRRLGEGRGAALGARGARRRRASWRLLRAQRQGQDMYAGQRAHRARTRAGRIAKCAQFAGDSNAPGGMLWGGVHII